MRGRTLIYTIALLGLLTMLASATMLGGELVLLGAARISITDALFELAFGAQAAWSWLGIAGGAVWGIASLVIWRRKRPDEHALAARKAYLSIGQGVALAALFAQAVRLITGLLTPIKPDAWPAEALGLLVGIAIALAFWAFLRATAAQDGDFGREIGAGAGWRRGVYYSLAAVALAALLVGLSGLLQIILQTVLGVGVIDAATATQNQARFAQVAALALAGAPIWWGCWWSQQSLARLPGDIGRRERYSRVRRLYLYAILLIAAIAFFFGAGMSILGLVTGRGMANAATWAPIAAVAFVCLGGHLWVLRGDERTQADGRRETEDATIAPVAIPATTAGGTVINDTTAAGVAAVAVASGPRRYEREALPPAAVRPRPIILVIDGGDGAFGARLLVALAAALPEAVLWPMGLNPSAQAAMAKALGGVATTALPDAPARATLIIGPSDMVVPGGLGGEVSAQLAAAVAAGPGRKLLLPPRELALRWVAAPDWSEERWIENAVIEAVNYAG
ncbi:MAG: DUF5671 domain-containing protein [Anaerolineae bacterium]|nr:DUF5671 domain-containing protein [Anaerolineae bacterium]